MVWQTPKTNWNDKDAVRPSDMNRIEGNILELKKAATIDIADAAGNFTTTNVEDALQELAGNVKNGKTNIANAITAMGQTATGNDTFDTLAAKIRDISKDATAGTGDVLSGKTFYQGGAKKTGTMPNNGVKTITPGPTDQALSGYYAPGSKVAAVTFDPSKVLAGTTIAGTAGTMPNRGAVVITPGASNKTIAAGYHNGQGYVKGDSNLVAMNIKKGVSIFDVNGNYVTPVIKSIQYGSATTPSQTGENTVTIDINAVDTSKSIVIIELKYARTGTSIRLSDISFISSTQFMIKIDAGYSSNPPFVWKVIEFNPDVVKSIQRGITRVSASEPTANVTISSVDRTKSIPITLNFVAVDQFDDAHYMKGGCYLTSNTNLRIEGNTVFSFDVLWNVIEFY